MRFAITAVQGWCPWCADHMSGGGWIMMGFWWILAIAAVVLVVWALRRGTPSESGRVRDPAEDALREQHAKGEIDEEMYQRRLAELRRP